jgi:hypothetical protein
MPHMSIDGPFHNRHNHFHSCLSLFAIRATSQKTKCTIPYLWPYQHALYLFLTGIYNTSLLTPSCSHELASGYSPQQQPSQPSPFCPGLSRLFKDLVCTCACNTLILWCRNSVLQLHCHTVNCFH